MNISTRPRPFVLAILLSASSLAAAPSAAQISGESIYQRACIACHATGVANAPKVGDQQAWKPLIAEGQAILTAHGWVGVRGMPPQGGDPKLGLEDFARAVAWMVRNSGGQWNDPDTATLKAMRLEARDRLQKDIAARQKLLKSLGQNQ